MIRASKHLGVVALVIVTTVGALALSVPRQPAVAALSAAGPQMVELPTLGGTSSEATAINDLGVSVGWSDLPGDVERHAVMWDRVGGIHDLGSLDVPPLGPDRGSFATAINDAGVVVGGSDAPFVWTAAAGMQPIRIEPLPWAGHANAVNRDGVVAGTLTTGVGRTQAFLWSADAGTIDAPASAIDALNDGGRWVGSSGSHAGGTGFTLIMGSVGDPQPHTVPLAPGVFSAFARDVNTAGTFVGTGRGTDQDPAGSGFVWSDASGFQWLPQLGFDTPVATAIDDSGRIAGTQNGRAATWSPGTEPIDLGVLPGDDASMVLGLSNAGQAVGYSSHPGPTTTDGLATEVHRAVRWGLAPPLPPTPPPDLPPPPPPIVVAPVPVAARPNFTG